MYRKLVGSISVALLSAAALLSTAGVAAAAASASVSPSGPGCVHVCYL